MSSGDFDSVVAALESAPLAGGMKGLTFHVVQQVPSLKQEDIESVLKSLFSLSVLVTDEDTPLSQNLASLTNAMRASGHQDLALSEQEKIELEKRLERILKVKALTIASKVQRLSLEYPNTFHNAMILTDMRPVFDNPEDRPVGCAIAHTLQITYHEGGEHKEFYVMLDAGDVETLKKVLLRAEIKASSVKSFLKSANLPDLS
jgi:hypothetical protein